MVALPLCKLIKYAFKVYSRIFITDGFLCG